MKVQQTVQYKQDQVFMPTGQRSKARRMSPSPQEDGHMNIIKKNSQNLQVISE